MLSIALAYIGSKNVVHRDIKPANILISTIGEKRVYKLTDFGIAQNDYDNKLKTVANNKTLSYSSLEQIDEKEADPSFDVWSLGITIY
jgi:eukaryotic-like serine/threonine-protein kinase